LRLASIFILAFILSACGHSTGGKTAPPASAQSQVSARTIVESKAGDATALETVARDGTAKMSRRYLALRKLEELGSRQVIAVATDLARVGGDEARMLRNNAVSVLVRAEQKGDSSAKAALDAFAGEPTLAKVVLALRVAPKSGGAK